MLLPPLFEFRISSFDLRLISSAPAASSLHASLHGSSGSATRPADSAAAPSQNLRATPSRAAPAIAPPTTFPSPQSVYRSLRATHAAIPPRALHRPNPFCPPSQ